MKMVRVVNLVCLLVVILVCGTQAKTIGERSVVEFADVVLTVWVQDQSSMLHVIDRLLSEYLLPKLLRKIAQLGRSVCSGRLASRASRCPCRRR